MGRRPGLPLIGWYGGIYDWHTLEGPAVRAQARRSLLLLLSVGRWQSNTYAVDYGISERITGPVPPQYCARPRR
jgi:hypothetical protein